MNVIALSAVLHDDKHKSRTYHHVQIWVFHDHIRVSGYYRSALYPLFRVETLQAAFDCAVKVKRKHKDISLRGPAVAV
jgi:hypothetical protein